MSGRGHRLCRSFNSREGCAQDPRHIGTDCLGYTGVEVIHMCGALEPLFTPGAVVRSRQTDTWFLSDARPRTLDPGTPSEDYAVGQKAVPVKFQVCGSAGHSIKDHLRSRSGVVNTGGKLICLMQPGACNPTKQASPSTEHNADAAGGSTLVSSDEDGPPLLRDRSLSASDCSGSPSDSSHSSEEGSALVTDQLQGTVLDPPQPPAVCRHSTLDRQNRKWPTPREVGSSVSGDWNMISDSAGDPIGSKVVQHLDSLLFFADTRAWEKAGCQQSIKDSADSFRFTLYSGKAGRGFGATCKHCDAMLQLHWPKVQGDSEPDQGSDDFKVRQDARLDILAFWNHAIDYEKDPVPKC